MKKFFGHFCLLITVIIWGSSFVATKIALGYFSAVEVMALRLLLALPAMIVVLALRGIRPNYQHGSVRPLIFGSIILIAHWLIQFVGISKTTATNTGWLIAVTPLAMAVASAMFLHERLRKVLWLGVVVASAGVVLLISHGEFSNLDWLSSTGDWLVFVSAHTWVVYTIVTRDLLRTHPPLLITATLFTPMAVLSILFVAITSDMQYITAMPTTVLVSLLYLGILGTAIAHWFWQEGVSRLGAARAGTFLYIEPLATTLVAVPLLHEYFGVSTAVGGGLVLLGVYFAQRKQRVTKVPG